MAQDTLRNPSDEHIEATPEEARQGMKGADVLAMLAVSTFWLRSG